MTQLTAVVGQIQQEKGKFPSQPQANPAGTHYVGEAPAQNIEQAKAITTLRSGKVVDKTISPKPVPSVAPVVVPGTGDTSLKENTQEPPEVEESAPAATT